MADNNIFQDLKNPAEKTDETKTATPAPKQEAAKPAEKPTEQVTQQQVEQSTQAPELVQAPPPTPPISAAKQEAIIEQEAEKADTLPQYDELDLLKRRANLMGITVNPNITLDALKQKISDAQTASEQKHVSHNNVASLPLDNPMENQSVRRISKEAELRKHLHKEKMKLVRLRISNLDPKKKDLQGEIITVANQYLGTVRKFIPFGEATDNGYHVPYVLYETLKDRKFLQIKTRRDKNTGQQIVEHNYVNEFSLEILPPLTPEELARLSTTQLAKGGI